MLCGTRACNASFEFTRQYVVRASCSKVGIAADRRPPSPLLYLWTRQARLSAGRNVSSPPIKVPAATCQSRGAHSAREERVTGSRGMYRLPGVALDARTQQEDWPRVARKRGGPRAIKALRRESLDFCSFIDGSRDVLPAAVAVASRQLSGMRHAASGTHLPMPTRRPAWS